MKFEKYNIKKTINSNLEIYPVHPFRGGGAFTPLKRYSYKKNIAFNKLLLILAKTFQVQTLKIKNIFKYSKNKINQLFLTIFNETKFYQNSKKKFCHTKFFPFLQKRSVFDFQYEISNFSKLLKSFNTLTNFQKEKLKIK